MKPGLLAHISIVTACIAAAVAAQAGAGTGTISGVVLNATCPGPCSIPPKPLPVYDGDNLVVVIKKLPERTVVARLYPKDGRFGVDVAPGLYRARARIRDGAKPSCWEGSARKAEVSAGETTRVRLRVTNVCVL